MTIGVPSFLDVSRDDAEKTISASPTAPPTIVARDFEMTLVCSWSPFFIDRPPTCGLHSSLSQLIHLSVGLLLSGYV